MRKEITEKWIGYYDPVMSYSITFDEDAEMGLRKERRRRRKEARKERLARRRQLIGIAMDMYKPGDDEDDLRIKVEQVLRESDVPVGCDRDWETHFSILVKSN